jgi:hypothetical protein
MDQRFSDYDYGFFRTCRLIADICYCKIKNSSLKTEFLSYMVKFKDKIMYKKFGKIERSYKV